MSAAAPPPPPHRIPPSSTLNVYRHSMSVGSGASYDNGEGFGKPRNGPEQPPGINLHLNDLAIKANQQVNTHMTIDRLLEQAIVAIKQADTFLRFGRPEEAYVEYLVAITIVATVIPRHKDQLMLSDRQSLRQKYNDLTSKLHAEQSKYDTVKDKIVQGNAANGVQPPPFPTYEAVRRDPKSERESRPTSIYGGIHRDQIQSYSNTSQRGSVLAPFSQDLGTSPHSPKSRPPVRPKPQELQGHVIATSRESSTSGSASGDALAERFSRLRMNEGQARISQQQSSWPFQSTFESRSPGVSSPKVSTTHSSYTAASRGASNASSIDSTTIKSSITTHSSVSSTMPTTHMPKAFPKPPSPAYSPVRDSYTVSSVPPPRSTPRSASGTYIAYSKPGLEKSGTSIRESQVSDGDSSDNLVRTPRESLAPSRRRKSVNMPQETEISAERLYDYLKIFDVLVVDVRSREDFDTGHIFTQHIVCVEPAQLREGMSADELQDSLVLSPQLEQEVFERRGEYDLVVYYDNSTESTDFLRRQGISYRDIAMKRLHDALYEFNQEKPLQWPPILLVGGINAWAGVVGVQALKTSNTASYIRALASRPQPPVQRTPIARNPSILTVQKKRHRDYNPLDAEEEKKWRERARSESVKLDQQSLHVDSQDQEEVSYLRSYDDFYLHFPDVASLERQSMANSPSQRVPPPSLNITYPAVFPIPAVPARPAPAVPRQSFSGVSERISPQTGASERATQLPPYIPPQYQIRNLRIPRTGLHNFGVTCYMNATIQCLSATLPLSTFFLSGAYKSHLQKDNWKGSKGLMPDLYNTLLSNLWKGDVDTIRPTNFRKFCARLNGEWGIDRQQDAKEFLEFLVDYLHEDLNTNWARTPLKELTQAEEAIRENTPPFVAAKKEWARYTHRDQSYLTSLFGGQHISRLQCTSCRHSSTTYEPFTSISVEIPVPRNANQSISIYDCLRSYSSTETLSGSEVWKCPSCNREREATKRITITRAPEYLIVHFKRFSASRSEKAKKVHTEINFPLHGLDLEPFMLPQPDEKLAAQITKAYDSDELRADASMVPPYKYDAYAVLRHIGVSLGSGHYVALVKDPVRKCWRRFDDDRVTDFTPEELPRSRGLTNAEAYIVFYQRVRD